MPRFFDVEFMYCELEENFGDNNRVYVYLEKGCQEFIFHAEKLILQKYHKREIDLDTFVRFKREAESGGLKFYVSEDYRHLMIK